MPRFKKGSPEAKAYMAKLRAMVGKRRRKVLKASSDSKASRNPIMARRRRYFTSRRRKGSFKIPLATVAGLLGGVALAKHPWAGPGGTTFVNKLMLQDWTGAFNDIGPAFTGFTPDGKFHFETILSTYGPMVAGALISKFVGGSPIGLNRKIAKIPFIKI